MDNKDRPAFSNSLSHQDWGVGTQQEVIERNAGLTKLEDFVKHNMPNLADSLKTAGAYGMYHYDCRINQFEEAQIDKTIAACKYALEKLEEARGNE